MKSFPAAKEAFVQEAEFDDGNPENPVEVQEEQGDGNPNPAPAKVAVERKIIYTATMEIVLENLDESQTELEKLVKKFQGFIATSSIEGSAGYRRTGTWSIRIPVTNFEEFREEVLSLGVPTENSLSSREVTEEFYDLKTRIETSKKHYDRLVKHLDQDTKDLKDILAVEQEIARVQRDVEVMQGKLRRLDDLTSLTTINVTLIEEKDYVPPQAPTFTGNIASTFGNSVESLQKFGKSLVLLVVALIPWIPVIVLATLCLGLTRRKLQKASDGTPETPPST